MSAINSRFKSEFFVDDNNFNSVLFSFILFIIPAILLNSFPSEKYSIIPSSVFLIFNLPIEYFFSEISFF